MPSPVLVAALAVACYVAVIAVHVAGGGDLRDYIQIGARFVTQSHASQVIRIDPRYRYLANGHGYDGQFYYYIALDPAKARFYADWNSYGRQAAAYRYSRILYPMVARALALGRSSWVPATLLLVNLLGVGLGTLAVAAWLRRFRLSPWLALLYPLYPGVVLGVLRDLADPLAFSLAAAAVYLLYVGSRYRVVSAGVLFGLAALARETTLLVPLVYSLWLLERRDIRDGVVLGLLGAGPALLWRAWLVLWLGSTGIAGKVGPVFPFTGLFHHWTADHVIQVLGVVVPALLLCWLALVAWRAGGRSPEVVVLLLNVLLFVVLLNPTSYVDIYASARMAIGVTLFALFALPTFVTTLRRPTWSVLAGCVALWGLAIAIPS